MRARSIDERGAGPSPRLFRLFRWYATRYVGRQFHAVRVSRTGLPPDLPDKPAVVVLNHPSWWDPLIALIVTGFLPPTRVHHAPIEAAGLAQYPFLARVGFFGFDSSTAAGAALFLRTSLSILSRPESVLWITGQGEFVDARKRPTVLRPGVGHLARRLEDAVILTMAVEYPFWDDRCPEALIRFGAPIAIESGSARSPREWTALIAEALESALDVLSDEAQARDPCAFSTLIQGTAGVGGVYDIWRRTRAWIGGKTFRPEHASRPAAGGVARPLDHPSGAVNGRNATE